MARIGVQSGWLICHDGPEFCLSDGRAHIGGKQAPRRASASKEEADGAERLGAVVAQASIEFFGKAFALHAEMQLDVLIEWRAREQRHECGMRFATSEVVQREARLPGREPISHREQRRDADARADQDVLARAFLQQEKISRCADRQLGADTHCLVQRARAAARFSLFFHGEDAGCETFRIAAQRILTREARGTRDVDIRARLIAVERQPIEARDTE